MSRRVVLFADNNEIKVVCGSMVISTPFEQVSTKRSYFENLFSSNEVVWATGFSLLGRDEFFSMMGLSAPVPMIPQPMAPQPAISQPAVPQPQLQPMPPPQPQPQPQFQVPQVQQLAAPQQPQTQSSELPRTVVSGPPKQKVFKDGNKWIVTEAEATIIVDDLFTGNEVRDSGRREALALIPGKPVNLARFPVEAIKKSSILRSLAQAGIVKSVSSVVAQKMLSAYEQQNDESDSMLIPSNVRASAFARGEREIGKDATVIDLDNEGSYETSEIDSMRRIMQEIDLAEEEKMIRQQEGMPDNPLSDSRPRRAADPSRAGRKISSDHFYEEELDFLR